MSRYKTPETLLKHQAKDFLAIYRVWTFPVLQGIGSAKGIPDRLGIYRGRPLAIEFKSPKGKLTENQERFRSHWESQGGIYILARSIEDLQEGLDIK